MARFGVLSRFDILVEGRFHNWKYATSLKIGLLLVDKTLGYTSKIILASTHTSTADKGIKRKNQHFVVHQHFVVRGG